MLACIYWLNVVIGMQSYASTNAFCGILEVEVVYKRDLLIVLKEIILTLPTHTSKQLNTRSSYSIVYAATA